MRRQEMRISGETGYGASSSSVSDDFCTGDYRFPDSEDFACPDSYDGYVADDLDRVPGAERGAG